MAARRLQQPERAHDVRLDELAGAVDRAVDVAFRGEVNDGPRPVRGKQRLDVRLVEDVALHEAVARVARERCQIGEVSRIGELVEVHHRLAAPGKPVEDEIRSDEPGAARHENRHLPAFCSSMSFRYLWNVLLQPITTCANPGPPSRKPSLKK